MIIVTGASGFIGSNIVTALNARGRTDILIVDDLGTQAKWKNLAKRRFVNIVHPAKVEAMLGSLGKVEAVFHMGANSSTTAVDGDEILASNLHSSMMWWNWCAANRTPLIYASSAATYGDGSQGFDDDASTAALDALRPMNLYGWSKHAFDKWATERAAEGQAPPQWAGLKFFNVFGPNEYHKGEMRSLVAKNTGLIASGQPIRLFRSHKDGYADGEQLRDFIYVKDCVAAMLWLLDHPQVSGLFNLGTGQARSFLDLMTAIGAALNKPLTVDFIDMPESIRHSYQYFTQARMSKFKAAGLDVPFHSLEDGVADYVRHYLTTADAYH